MDGNEVGGAALVGVGADLLRRLLGPAADEAGAWMADWIKTRRLASLIAAVKQAISDLEAHDVDWHVVDWKVAFPILEGASLERDDDIVAMWGHLLASAAATDTVLPAFPHLLRQLSSDEARLLDWIYAEEVKHEMRFQTTAKRAREALALSGDRTRVLIYNLVRLGLLMVKATGSNPVLTQNPDLAVDDHVALSTVGRAFVEACRGPLSRAT